jgi:alpha-L-rhamnosidase
MCGWTDFVIRSAGDDRHWESPFQFGDWLDPAAPPDDPSAARTDRHLVANAWFCKSLDIMTKVSSLLSDDKSAQHYRDVAREARASFAERYITADGRMSSDAQTAYALALCFDLVDEQRRGAAGQRLGELVRAEGHRIGTGFAGTPLICDALCAAGETDSAYELLFQTEAPSWLYPVLHGATTIWERWDGIRPDGSRNPGEMNSFNHYALGAVADWLHRTVAGLAPADAGYRRILVQPRPNDRLDHAVARHDTPYGRAEVGWQRDGKRVVVTATVPPNTSATVALPDGRPSFDVGAGRHEWTLDASRGQ